MIEIYTTSGCPMCARAKELMQRRSLDYREISLTRNPQAMRSMLRRSRSRSLPQIFIDGVFIGGYPQLVELDLAGRLTPESADE